MDEKQILEALKTDIKHWPGTALHYAFEFCERHDGKFWEELREAIRQEIIDKGGRTR